MTDLMTDVLGAEGPRDPVDPKQIFEHPDITGHTAQHVALVNGEVRDLADTVFALVPPSPERTLAMRHLELAGYYAHASLVREGVADEEEGGFVEIDRRRRVRERVEGMVARAVQLTRVYLTQPGGDPVALIRKIVQDLEARKRST